MRATIFFGWTVPAVNAVSDLETSAELRAILAAISLNRFANEAHTRIIASPTPTLAVVQTKADFDNGELYALST